jgi:hypothetical protein
MDRLRRSNGFHAETVQLGRKIIAMKADSRADEDFQIKSMEREFPPLPGTGESTSSKQNLGLVGWNFFLALTVNILELISVGITADVGISRALLSDRQCHFYGSKGSVPEAFFTGISTVLAVSPVLCSYRALCI